MSRQARVVAEAVPHHATQRGNNRQDIFLTDDDRLFYLQTLRQKSEQFGLTILGYCLMTNHVHVVAVPRRADSLAKALGQTHWRYAMRFNRDRRRSGHLWQGLKGTEPKSSEIGDRRSVTGTEPQPTQPRKFGPPCYNRIRRSLVGPSTARGPMHREQC